MKTTSHLKLTMVPCVTGSIRCPPLRRVFLFVPLLLTCFALSQTAKALSPAPDGGYAGENTAEGTGALSSLTNTAAASAVGNSALGFNALKNTKPDNFGFGGQWNTAAPNPSSGKLKLMSLWDPLCGDSRFEKSLSHLFADSRNQDFSPVGRATMFEQENALPGSELHFAINNRHGLAGPR
jgi:hypothetical protein